jgi:hypothetical protein
MTDAELNFPELRSKAEALVKGIVCVASQYGGADSKDIETMTQEVYAALVKAFEEGQEDAY